MIEVKKIVKKYGNHLVLDDLSFTVEDNQVFGLLGVNGAGKSTTMNIITGYLSPTSGTIIVNGHDMAEEPIEAKQVIGYLPELPPVYMDMTPYEYLKFVGQAKKIKKDILKDEIEKAMQKTGITDVKNRLIKALSKGYRQRVGLAQAILGNPLVIILDEPTVGLDPIQIIEFRDLIKELGKEHTVIISSHILAEIEEICQKIMIISKGKLIAIDTPENLSKGLEQGVITVLQIKTAHPEEAVMQIKNIQGIKTAEITKQEKDVATIEVKAKPGRSEMREAISETMMKGRFVVLAIEEKELSVEEIFIKLIDSNDEHSRKIKEEKSADNI